MEFSASPMHPAAPVSVVMPTFNAGRYLEPALQSIEDQTAKPLEVIIVDDASTDGTPQRAREFAAESSLNIRLLVSDVNSGTPARPLNTGIGAATGELIAVLDQDDVWLPEKLQEQTQVLMQQPSVSFVCAQFGLVGAGDKNVKLGQMWKERLTPVMTARQDCYTCPGHTAFELFVQWENFTAGFPGFMFRRRDWEARPGFDESLTVAADFDFLFWLCSQGDMAFIPATHYLRREHETNVTYREVPRLLDVIRILLRNIGPQEFAASFTYRAAVGWKLLRLAQFIAYSGHIRVAAGILGRFYQVRRARWDWLYMPYGYSHIAVVKLLGRVLQFTRLRKAGRQEAVEAASEVDAMLTDAGFISAASAIQETTVQQPAP